MRRNNLNKYSAIPRISSHLSPSPSIMQHSEPLKQSFFHSIEKYQNQIAGDDESSPLIKFRVNKKSNKTYATIKEEDEQTDIFKDLVKATKEVSQLRSQLHNRKYSIRQRTESRMQEIVSGLTQSLKRKNSFSPSQSIQQPIYYPIQMPFPMYMPQIQPPQNNSDNHSHYRQSRSSLRSDSFYLRKNKILNRQQKASRVKRNMKLWRKAGNCILFIIYLKRFCRLFQTSRRQYFQKSIAKIKGTLNILRKNIEQNLKPFLKLLLLKSDLQFDIKESENKQIKKQKAASIRRMVGMLIDALIFFGKQYCKKIQAVQCMYYLCKHGNYSHTQPLLTVEQMELICMSTAFGYVSADKNLQKAALINLIIIKLLLYNILLSPQMIGHSFTNETVTNNLYVISSVAYELVLDVQDEYMLQVSPSYKIGNFKGFNKIRILESIVVKNQSQRAGELISGLKGQEWIRKYFSVQSWKQEKKGLMNFVDSLQSKIAAYHRKIMVKFL